MNIFTPLELERDCIVVIGKESTGKSQLIASLTGQSALQEPNTFPSQWIAKIAGWQIEPQPTLLEHPRLGWLLAIALLLIPTVIAVWGLTPLRLY